MKLRRALHLLFVLCVAALLPLGLGASTAAAQVNGGCTVTFNGQNANNFSTPGSALKVDKDSTVQVEGRAPSQVTGHHIQLEFFGIKWTVSSGVDHGSRWTGTANVKKYAKYGVGLYKVIGSSTGAACSGFAFIKITGKNAFTTAAGLAAAVLTLLGLILLVVGTVRAGRAAGRGLRFSVSGIIGGLLGALGVMVLLQQLGTIYPTATIGIIGLVGGLVLGIALPSLRRMAGGGSVAAES